MKKIIFLLIISFNFAFSQSNQNYLENGNDLLSENKFSEAENIFRKGLKKEPENLIFKSQLAFALIYQNKNDQAENIITEILKIDPSFTAALWYGGINNFSKDNPDLRKAIEYFEKSYDLINPNSDQYFAVNYYIGKSYQKLLYTEGLSYDEVNRMLETLQKYIDLQPNAEETTAIRNFILKAEEKRPGKNVGRWIISTDHDIIDKMKKLTE